MGHRLPVRGVSLLLPPLPAPAAAVGTGAQPILKSSLPFALVLQLLLLLLHAEGLLPRHGPDQSPGPPLRRAPAASTDSRGQPPPPGPGTLEEAGLAGDVTDGPGRPAATAGTESRHGVVTSLPERGEGLRGRGRRPARESQRHRRGAAAVEEEARVGGSGPLRHGRYQRAPAGGGARVITTLRSRETLPLTWRGRRSGGRAQLPSEGGGGDAPRRQHRAGIGLGGKRRRSTPRGKPACWRLVGHGRRS